MILIDGLIAQIKESLFQYAKEVYDKRLSNKSWTDSIKRRIGELGFENGCRVCTSGFPEEFESEWLYDLIWYQNDESKLKNIPLIMECEWDRKFESVKGDFEKLIQARADVRVMIFQGYKEEIDRNFQWMITGIEMFKHSTAGDRYLLAGLDWSEGGFRFVDYIKK